MGGKSKSKKWTRSIYHSNFQFGLASIDILSDRSVLLFRELPVILPVLLLLLTVASQLSDPVLAFIKPYRLRGDMLGLKQAVFSSFDASSLSAAYKSLWEFCNEDLELLNFTHHERRGSAKRQFMDVVHADILLALEKLDVADKLPPIY